MIRIAKKFARVIRKVETPLNEGIRVTLYPNYLPPLGAYTNPDEPFVYYTDHHYRESFDNIRENQDPVELVNDQVYVTLDFRKGDEQITIRDRTDMNNCPVEFNLTRRNITHLFYKVMDEFNDKTTMSNISTWASNLGIRMHYYCSMD